MSAVHAVLILPVEGDPDICGDCGEWNPPGHSEAHGHHRGCTQPDHRDPRGLLRGGTGGSRPPLAVEWEHVDPDVVNFWLPYGTDHRARVMGAGRTGRRGLMVGWSGIPARDGLDRFGHCSTGRKATTRVEAEACVVRALANKARFEPGSYDQTHAWLLGQMGTVLLLDADGRELDR